MVFQSSGNFECISMHQSFAVDSPRWSNFSPRLRKNARQPDLLQLPYLRHFTNFGEKYFLLTYHVGDQPVFDRLSSRIISDFERIPQSLAGNRNLDRGYSRDQNPYIPLPETDNQMAFEKLLGSARRVQLPIFAA